MKSFYYILLCLFLVLSFSCKNDKQVEANSLTDTVEEDETTPSDPLTANFLTLSDVHLDDSLGMVGYGSVSGDSIWKRTIRKIDSVSKHEKPRFMVYLGDLPNYYSNITHNIGEVLKDFRDLDGDFPILYLPGNNDTMKGDYHSFQDGVSPNGTTIFSLDDVPTNPWPIINRNSKTTTISNLDFNKEFGYYSVDLNVDKEVLKVVALNSVIFCRKGRHNHYRPNDGVSQDSAAQNQFSWLEKTIDGFDTTDNVLLMMHIPPGRDGHGFNGDNMWNDNLYVTDKNGNSVKVQNGFLDLLKNNQPKIRGMLTSHTHLDGLRRIYAADDNTDPNKLITVSISTPGISLNHNNNPGFKSFEFNITDFELINFKTYYAEPTAKTNPESYNNFNFKYISKPYTFKDTYKITDPSTSIFTDIKGLKDASSINGYMKQILGVYTKDPNVTSGFYYDHALDVLYQ
ncbi:metallophosphoesterase [uncultured Psychroserpens sp.]|uniref:metallophosphoesterase n=1 Tax=uncultured Psychroserpens sp. TaxID=255436 RepID=UPI002634AA67|nr:metallophosphoesterase [uncultured Psychroserpens sp.]